MTSKKPKSPDYEYNYSYDDHPWSSYKPVKTRQHEAKKVSEELQANGQKLEPVKAAGRRVAKTFWGQAWCANLEAYHDYESRLPTGRSYLRNGSVIDLKISNCRICALVHGTTLYTVEITFDRLDEHSWKKLISLCSSNINSVADLLSGQLSNNIMSILTSADNGLFPSPKEVKMGCNCLDHADMCKHIAATLYGTGVRLDERPELFFTLRGVRYQDLVSTSSIKIAEDASHTSQSFDAEALSDLFGIDLHLD